MNPTQLLSARMVMQRLSIARSTLHKWQHTRAFPRPLKIDHNVVRWNSEDVDLWIANNLKQNLEEVNA